jgi:hypothetical protein
MRWPPASDEPQPRRSLYKVCNAADVRRGNIGGSCELREPARQFPLFVHRQTKSVHGENIFPDQNGPKELGHRRRLELRAYGAARP